ncbi:MAG: BrnA antitoxin family protein [Caulobacteraceae bacterium]
MSNKPLSPEEREQLARLASMPEEEIDTSDIPEITDEMWERAFQPGLHRPIKRPVTIRLDADVVSWFKENAGDKPYQTEINRVLRRHVVNAKRHA